MMNMKSRAMILGLAAVGVAGLFLGQVNGAMLAAFHLEMLDFLTPENCKRCAHAMVSIALLVEAVALWMEASRGGHKTLKVVALMFGAAGVLGAIALLIELAPHFAV